MRVKVRYFAGLREKSGVAVEVLHVKDDALVRQAVDAVVAAHPAIGTLLDRCRVAVEREFATLDTPLSDGDELALLPPVSGG